MSKKDSTPLINVTIPKPQIYSLKWGTNHVLNKRHIKKDSSFFP